MSDLLQRLNAGIDVANRRLLTLRTQQDIEVALVFREILVETRDEIERLGRELTEARDGIKEVMSDHADTLARLDEVRGRLSAVDDVLRDWGKFGGNEAGVIVRICKIVGAPTAADQPPVTAKDIADYERAITEVYGPSDKPTEGAP